VTLRLFVKSEGKNKKLIRLNCKSYQQSLDGEDAARIGFEGLEYLNDHSLLYKLIIITLQKEKNIISYPH